MACKRSAVRSRLPPPTRSDETPSSRGLGHRPFTAVTGVRIPVGSPNKKATDSVAFLFGSATLFANPGKREAFHRLKTRSLREILSDASCERIEPGGSSKAEQQSAVRLRTALQKTDDVYLLHRCFANVSGRSLRAAMKRGLSWLSKGACSVSGDKLSASANGASFA
jgi:hypothetical protein